MSVWKDFCRKVESKGFVRQFGDLVPIIDRCALFEFSEEQMENAQMHVPADLSKDDGDYPIPPFPFPSLCITSSEQVLVLHSPSMNEETGLLEFGMMLYHPRLEHSWEEFFQQATCVVEATKLDDDGQFPMKLRDLKGVFGGRYFDEDSPLIGGTKIIEDAAKGAKDQHAKELKKAQSQLEEIRAAGKSVVEAEGIIADLAERHSEIEALEERLESNAREMTRAEKEGTRVVIEGVSDAFYKGLQTVNWINHPDHFTIELEAVEGRKKKKANRIRRTHERSSHIILTKTEIATRWHTAHQGGTHASPLPHLRRGHYKTLRAARFKEKRGQRIWVRASHVGGECVEWRHGDRSYKVL